MKTDKKKVAHTHTYIYIYSYKVKEKEENVTTDTKQTKKQEERNRQVKLKRVITYQRKWNKDDILILSEWDKNRYNKKTET